MNDRMPGILKESYAHCRALARRAASSFYLSFFLLPRAKRDAMFALYAFLRRTDDLGDSDRPLETRRQQLLAWREEVGQAFAGRSTDLLLPAVVDTVRRFHIPREYLTDALDGVAMDLAGCEYATFADLEIYCHKVASVVGLACIHIWGFTSDEAFAPARKCGLAFQMTNILRDLQEDARRGRVYLPREDLAQFHLTAADLLEEKQSAALRDLVRYEVARTMELYAAARPLAKYLSCDGRRAFRVMLATYQQLLAEISRREGDVFSRPVKLSRWEKLRIAVGELVWPTTLSAQLPRPSPARLS